MAEQSVDLRSTLSVLRRHRLVLAIAALIGIAAGVSFVVLRPPQYASYSQVLLPQLKSTDGQTPVRDVQTEIRIATSDGVFGPAGQTVKPPLSVQAMARHVHVSAPASDVIAIQARASTPELAKALAEAVANAEVDYVTKAASSLSGAETAALAQRRQGLEDTQATVGDEIKKTQGRIDGESPTSAQGQKDAAVLAQLTAQQASLAIEIDTLKTKEASGQPDSTASILSHASPAKRPGLVSRSIGFSLFGVLVAVGLAAMILTLRSRRDRKLRYRDEIADALGSPVIASVRSRVPRAAAGWASLLEDYTPGTVDAWALRQALHQLVLDGSPVGRPHGDRGDGAEHTAMSITVITLSDDPRGLAMGPQLAAYAASSGIPTALVAGQRHESAASLWAAFSQGRSEVRPGLLVDAHPRDGHDRDGHDVDLTVVLAVVDRRKPELTELPESSVAILAVSSGSATAEELALTAVTADDVGSRIAGIIVADPDDLDRTTGRLLQHERSQQIALPTRLTGVPSTGPTGTNVAGLRRRPR
ncbi:Wzz/FepE/Etk N-terminal domain-containing protein [Nocardioides ungokensis]